MENVSCVICKQNVEDVLNLGEMCKTGKYSAHYLCVLLANNIKQSGKDDEGILGFLASDISEAIKSYAKKKCWYCNKMGASITCARKKCKIQFHLPCGVKNNASHQFYGKYASQCMSHRPRQRYTLHQRQHVCLVCYEQINFFDWCQVISAPCCKQSSFFHRPCLQKLALSAGYYLKCPCCNDSKTFTRTLKQYGVFIPNRDASWERLPGAYQELLYRHKRCDVNPCFSWHRHSYRGTGRWRIVLCKSCGSKGTHLFCSRLKKNSKWLCNDCTPASTKKPARKGLSSTITSADQQALTSQEASTSQQSSTSRQALTSRQASTSEQSSTSQLALTSQEASTSQQSSTSRQALTSRQASTSEQASTSQQLPITYQLFRASSSVISCLQKAIAPTASHSSNNDVPEGIRKLISPGITIRRVPGPSSANEDTPIKTSKRQLGRSETSATQANKTSQMYSVINLETDSSDDNLDAPVVDDEDKKRLALRKKIRNNQAMKAQSDLEVDTPATASNMNFVISNIRTIMDTDKNDKISLRPRPTTKKDN